MRRHTEIVDSDSNVYVGRVRCSIYNERWLKRLVGLHQRSVLSSLLFIMVTDVHDNGGFLWELLYANDLIQMAKGENKLRENG